MNLEKILHIYYSLISQDGTVKGNFERQKEHKNEAKTPDYSRF